MTQEKTHEVNDVVALVQSGWLRKKYRMIIGMDLLKQRVLTGTLEGKIIGAARMSVDHDTKKVIGYTDGSLPPAVEEIMRKCIEGYSQTWGDGYRVEMGQASKEYLEGGM